MKLRYLLGVTIILAMFLVTASWAANDLIAGSYDKIATDGTVKTLTLAKYFPTTGTFAKHKAIVAIITVETSSIRWLTTGDNPDQSTAVGIPQPPLSTIRLDGYASIANFKFTLIAGASPGVVHVLYYFAPLPIMPLTPQLLPAYPVTPTLP